MNRTTKRAVLVVAGLTVLLITAAFSSLGYAALSAPADQAAQPTATPVLVSSQGGGVVEVLPAEGAATPTPLAVATPSSAVLPETGRGPDPTVYIVLVAAGVIGVAFIVVGLWLRRGRRRGPTM
jgi:hypothetical protein